MHGSAEVFCNCPPPNWPPVEVPGWVKYSAVRFIVIWYMTAHKSELGRQPVGDPPTGNRAINYLALVAQHHAIHGSRRSFRLGSWSIIILLKRFLSLAQRSLSPPALAWHCQVPLNGD